MADLAKDIKASANQKDKYKRTWFLKLFQHLLVTAAMVALLVVITGSTVLVNRSSGPQSYSMSTSDEGRRYEDSVLFNTIYGNEVSDVLRLVTIRSQLETRGSYNPDIVVDVIAYNQRTSAKTDIVNNPVSLKYYLGDLLKWARYGFEYDLFDESKLSPSANNLIYNDYDGLDRSEDSISAYELLINRYKTIDGRGIEECASTWEEYNYLIEQVETAASSLYYNYTDYLTLSDYFKRSNSNIRYCVVMNTSEIKPVIYTNTDLSDVSIDKIGSTFKGFGKYISYNYDTMIYSTNTLITESTFNSLISKYEYAFPDNCRIYIAADMSMPVNDCLANAQKGFNNYLPYCRQLYGLIVACVVLYLALLVLCTIREGYVITADGKKTVRLTGFDNSPIEIWLFLCVIFLAIIPSFSFAFLNDRYSKFIDFAGDLYVRIAFGVVVFIYDVVILGLFYSFVRRIKGRNIWKESFLKKIIDSIKNGMLTIYDNGALILKSWVPLGILWFINLVLILLTVKENGIFLLFMAAFDILAGIFIYKQVKARQNIIDGMRKIVNGDFSYKAATDELHGDNIQLAGCVNQIGDSIRNAVEQSMKDERMKSDLIANVSHDIRTPLTSIINYVDLIKRENIDNENIKSYVKVIDEKSQRLKALTDDLIEASKVSSGNIELELQRMNLSELINQSLAEFEDKLTSRNLTCIYRNDKAEATTIMADGKSLWRIMENLFGNVCKYAMPGSRVFVDLFNVEKNDKRYVVFQMRNISENPLPADLSLLTERFIRGDESRTTQGSGLGLSIAKSLTELMGGQFELASDADLFKAEVIFETTDATVEASDELENI